MPPRTGLEAERIGGEPDTKAPAANSSEVMALSATVSRETIDPMRHWTWKNRVEFHKSLKDAAKTVGIAITGPLLKTVTAELGEQHDTADVCLDAKGNPEPDTSLRDTENVPWEEDVDEYVRREVLPYAPDAWIDHAKTKQAAEIPFTRHFYQYVPPRPLEEIDRDLEAVMDQLRAMLVQVET